MHYGAWLQSARVQERDSGVDHRELACYASKLTPYVRDHLSHALQGMEELYMLIPSTAPDEAEQREEWESFREEFITRTRKALDHIGATLCAVGCTDEQLAKAVQAPDGQEEEEEDTQDDKDVPGDDGDAETVTMKIPEPPVVLSLSKKI